MLQMVCCQPTPVLGDGQGSLAAAEAIRDAVAGGAHVVVLSELATSGYCFASAEEAALDAGDPGLDQWVEAAGSAVVVAGFTELAGDRHYDSALLLNVFAGRFVYRKAHLLDKEHLFFTTVELPPPVIQTPPGRIGMMVYDSAFLS